MSSVMVVPYDANWNAEFDKIKTELVAALDEIASVIEHVGSTSVEGLPAKPVIDIDIVIKNYDTFEAAKSRLAEIGYRHNGDQGIKDRQAFVYEGKSHLMRHHLYVCPEYSEELRRHTAFRDYLREHPEDRDFYASIKVLAARTYPDSIDNYLIAKGPCIEELYRRCGLLDDLENA